MRLIDRAWVGFEPTVRPSVISMMSRLGIRGVDISHLMS